MILKSLVLASLLFTTSLTYSSTEDIFRVAPYTLKHTNGHLLLNFQTKADLGLVIEDNGQSKYAFNYKKNEHYKVELSTVPCGSVKEFKILTAETRSVVYKNTQPASPCPSSVSGDEFVFGFISDTQQYTERHADIAKIIAHHNSIEPMQFLINGGDVVQNGDKQEQEWIDYFVGGKSYLMDIPQIAAIGNHDYRGAGSAIIPKYFKQFMRWEGADKFGNLFFDMSEFQLLILNSNFSKLSDMQEFAVWNWVEHKMIDAKKINKPLIVATHFPLFSSSLNRFSTMSVIKLRMILGPLAEKYKIPLVLSGHTHMYERSFKDGVHYVVAGPAGGRANSPSYTNPYMKFFDKDSLTFTKIKLANKVFTLETYNQENRMIDSVVIDLNTKNLAGL
ncbi:MAG: metallophosphoesterase [Bacteriovorax sp.]|jgi:predicted phosphodiesterase